MRESHAAKTLSSFTPLYASLRHFYATLMYLGTPFLGLIIVCYSPFQVDAGFTTKITEKECQKR